MASTPAPAKQRRRTALLALPYDVVVDIVGLVAATSTHPFADLSSIAATCKFMYAATKEPEVLGRVALDKEKRRWHNNRYKTLIGNLVGARNPEACFLSGLMHVFMPKYMQLGLAFLEQAAAKCHKKAAYVLGIVLYNADDTRNAAKRYISQVEAHSDARNRHSTKRTNAECSECGHHASWAMVQMCSKQVMWDLREVFPKPYDNQCGSKGCGSGETANYNAFCSDDCRIKYEYNRFMRLLNGLLFYFLQKE
ncbi:hypothetical protein ACQ4PT_016114 [Festuca glaucescens]